MKGSPSGDPLPSPPAVSESVVQTGDSRWWDPSVIVAVGALLVSGYALLDARKANRIADDALSLSKREFVAARRLILRGAVDAARDEIQLIPTTPEATLQSGTAYFPSDLEREPRPILAPGCAMPIPGIKIAFADVLSRRLHPKAGTVLVSLDLRVPVVIATEYVVRGEHFSDLAMYAVHYEMTMDDQPPHVPHLVLKSISFEFRLSADDLPVEQVDARWRQVCEEDGSSKTPSGRADSESSK
jgi:hypothetical protein